MISDYCCVIPEIRTTITIPILDTTVILKLHMKLKSQVTIPHIQTTAMYCKYEDGST